MNIPLGTEDPNFQLAEYPTNPNFPEFNLGFDEGYYDTTGFGTDLTDFDESPAAELDRLLNAYPPELLVQAGGLEAFDALGSLQGYNDHYASSPSISSAADSLEQEISEQIMAPTPLSAPLPSRLVFPGEDASATLASLNSVSFYDHSGAASPMGSVRDVPNTPGSYGSGPSPVSMTGTPPPQMLPLSPASPTASSSVHGGGGGSFIQVEGPTGEITTWDVSDGALFQSMVMARRQGIFLIPKADSVRLHGSAMHQWLRLAMCTLTVQEYERLAQEMALESVVRSVFPGLLYVTNDQVAIQKSSDNYDGFRANKNNFGKINGAPFPNNKGKDRREAMLTNAFRVVFLDNPQVVWGFIKFALIRVSRTSMDPITGCEYKRVLHHYTFAAQKQPDGLQGVLQEYKNSIRLLNLVPQGPDGGMTSQTAKTRAPTSGLTPKGKAVDALENKLDQVDLTAPKRAASSSLTPMQPDATNSSGAMDHVKDSPSDEPEENLEEMEAPPSRVPPGSTFVQANAVRLSRQAPPSGAARAVKLMPLLAVVVTTDEQNWSGSLENLLEVLKSREVTHKAARLLIKMQRQVNMMTPMTVLPHSGMFHAVLRVELSTGLLSVSEAPFPLVPDARAVLSEPLEVREALKILKRLEVMSLVWKVQGPDRLPHSLTVDEMKKGQMAASSHLVAQLQARADASSSPVVVTPSYDQDVCVATGAAGLLTFTLTLPKGTTEVQWSLASQNTVLHVSFARFLSSRAAECTDTMLAPAAGADGKAMTDMKTPRPGEAALGCGWQPVDSLASSYMVFVSVEPVTWTRLINMQTLPPKDPKWFLYHLIVRHES